MKFISFEIKKIALSVASEYNKTAILTRLYMLYTEKNKFKFKAQCSLILENNFNFQNATGQKSFTCKSVIDIPDQLSPC